MASQARKDLAALAARHGIAKDTLTLIKDALMPAHPCAEPLSDRLIGQVADAVSLIIESGLAGEEIADTIDAHRTNDGEQWRERFWRERLRIAGERERTHGGEQQPPPTRPLAVTEPIPPQPPREIRPASGGSDRPLAA
jgi:hypothetical protein